VFLQAAHALWQDVLLEVERLLGASAVDLWLRQAALVEACREEVVIAVATPFERERLLSSRLATALGAAFESLLGARPALRVEVDPLLAEPFDERQPEPRPPAAPTGCPPRAPAPDLSFDAFVTGPSNRLAREAALRVARAPGDELNPLVICGGPGSGKTHLLSAIAGALEQAGSCGPVIFATAEEFANQFTAGIRNRRTTSFRDRYRGAAALLIDDIHLICSKPKTQIEFLHTFEALFHAGRQIVVTSEEDPKRLAPLHPGLAGRFLAGLVVSIEPPDLETRRRIVEDRARRLRMPLSSALADFLARNVTRSPRDLCGALAILKAHAAIGERLDLALAERHLRDILGPRPRLAPEALLVEIVAESFAIDAPALMGGGRGAGLARARQVAMYLVRRLTPLSLKEIGALFRRGPSTVTSAEARIGALAAADAALREALAACDARFRERTR
jgi:chromosomal replication initiator protein